MLNLLFLGGSHKTKILTGKKDLHRILDRLRRLNSKPFP